MTPRQRFIKTLDFGQPDRFFYYFGRPRRSTVEAWYLQGLPRMPDAGDSGCPDEFFDFVGIDRPPPGLPVESNTYPRFEPRVIQEDDTGQIWMDEHGITMHDAGKHLKTPGFRTRSYLSHPVKNRNDWIRLRDERFDPHAPGRYPADWPVQVEKLKDHEHLVEVRVAGLFWKCRDWVGFENLCLMFYDNPSLVHDMMEYRTWFIMTVLDRALRDVQVDAVMINEDMAYKQHAMISPKTFKEFMLPRYKRLVDFFKERSVPIITVDSDGYIGELIPLWIEAGVNATFPVEIAAGNDPVEFRKRYGKAIALRGGIDKREIRSKERTYQEVMRKVPWLIEQGGYMPGIDHAVPPDIPLRSYLYMCELLKALAEGRPVPAPNEPLAIEAQLGPIERMWAPDANLYEQDQSDDCQVKE